jgi:hypothetical protein
MTTILSSGALMIAAIVVLVAYLEWISFWTSLPNAN